MRRRVQLAVVVAALASSSAWIGPAPSASASTLPTAAVIVRAGDESTIAAAIETLAADGVEPDDVWKHALNGFAVAVDAEQTAALDAIPGVVVEPDLPITLDGTQTSPPWGLDRIDQRMLPLSGSYTTTATGAGVRAYVVDSGINASHTEFAGRIAPGFVAPGAGTSTDASDCAGLLNSTAGHGTHVAGILAGRTYGVAKEATIVPVRVFGCGDTASTSDVIAGVDWVVENHRAGEPAVANLSLGGLSQIGRNLNSLDLAVQRLINDGVTVVIAAGNAGTDACYYSPAHVAGAITVGASDQSDAAASYSNFGTCLDLYAPGSGIRSAWLRSPSDSAVLDGTSMAAPHVAGAAALLLQSNPQATPSWIASRLSADATTGVLKSLVTGDPDRLLYVEPASPPSPSPPTSASFTGVVPSRFFETRPGQSTVDGLQNGVGRLVAGTVGEVIVGGRSPVGADGVAVVLNVTVVDPAASGFVTVYPCGTTPPNASSVNFTAGATVANSVVSKIGAGGRVCVYSPVATDLLVDVTGWFGPTGGFAGLVPARLLDSRPGQSTVDGRQAGIGVRPNGAVTPVDVGGRASVLLDASAAVLNVTVTNPIAAGFVTVYPCGTTPPNASSVNFTAGATVANAVVSQIGAGGQVCVYTPVQTDLIVDVTGWFGASGGFTGVVPSRFYEARPAQSTVDGRQNGTGTRGSGWITEVEVSGRAPIPANAGAVVLNVTVTNPVSPGFVTVHPCGTPPPNASSLNFTAGATVANAVVSSIGVAGKVCVYTPVPLDLVVDVTGWFP